MYINKSNQNETVIKTLNHVTELPRGKRALMRLGRFTVNCALYSTNSVVMVNLKYQIDAPDHVYYPCEEQVLMTTIKQ